MERMDHVMYRVFTLPKARFAGTACVLRPGRRATALARRTSTLVSASRPNLMMRRGMGALALCMAFHNDARFMARCAEGGKAAGGQSGGKGGADDDEFAKLIEQYGPLTGDITLGAIVGFSSGYALKKIGKAAAFIIGVVFIGAQTASYLGYINVNWRKVEGQVTTLFDQDGDNKLTNSDVVEAWKKIKKVLTIQLPSAGGFASGFALGVLKG